MYRESPTAIAVGNFDGFHLGHQELLKRLRMHADHRRLTPGALTFKPNPKVYFGRAIPLIFTDSQKEEVLKKQQIDRVIFLSFSEVVRLSAEDFIRRILIGKFGMRALVVGENFRFGAGRTGTIDLLTHIARQEDFSLEVVPSLTFEGERISSSRIRKLLVHGDVERAGRLLGRNYFIDGIVVSGAGRGRKLGFPTINLKTDNQILPRGVFATLVEWKSKCMNAVTNIGSSPTFGRSFEQVETHILDFRKNIYGHHVRLHFIHKLRDEFRFDGPDELVAQIRRDVGSFHIDRN